MRKIYNRYMVDRTEYKQLFAGDPLFKLTAGESAESAEQEKQDLDLDV